MSVWPGGATAHKLSADILLLSGDRQAAGISHGDEIAEMPELHHNLLCVAHPCPAGMGPTYKVFLKRASDPYSKIAFYARSAREAGPIPIPNTMKAL